jgi:hypothetical protein
VANGERVEEKNVKKQRGKERNELIFAKFATD